MAKQPTRPPFETLRLGQADALRRIEDEKRAGSGILDLSNLGLTSLPEQVGELTYLIRLNLAHNQLISLPTTIVRLTSLTWLDLSRNQFTSLPLGVGDLSALQWLYLEYNYLTTLPKTNKWRRLTVLSAHGNRLTELSRGLEKIDSLRVLTLHDNPELQIPPEILGAELRECISPGGLEKAAKPKELLAYYFKVRRGAGDAARPLNEAKILVVGEPGVGKSMLIEWLVNGKAPKRDTEWTKGIKIVPWKVPCAEDGGEQIKVNIWDFGGQEIMQATHQFFLTERSLYLLVLDSRENEEQSKVRYWLEKIRAFGGDSPVIVVLNKRDQGQFEPDGNRLRIDYAKNLRELPFFQTSCKSGDGTKAGLGIEELRQAITTRVQELENITQPVPADFLRAKAAFETASESKKRMDRAGFDAICKANGVTDGLDRDTLLSYLKSLGSVFHYKRGDQDHRVLVLNPLWLTGGVYRLLTDTEVRARGGVLQPKDVARIFTDDRDYPKSSRQFILDMMEGDPFELSFKIPNTDDHRLIPELLSPNEPPHGIDPTRCLNLEYRYKFLPAGLIPRFIVRMHNVLKQGDAWKNGVVLRVDGRRVLVRGSREQRRVFVSADGREPAARRALAIVRQNLDFVHGAMKHLDVVEHVALPDDPGEGICYSDLLQYEREEGSAYQFRPPGAARKYSIRELLDGIEEPEWRKGGTRRETRSVGGGTISSESSELSIPALNIPEGQVFLSYANEPDPSHAQMVKQLADKLREQGVGAFVDAYIAGFGPDQGWPKWMEERVGEARVVLMICSPTYLRRFDGKEQPGKGLGATFEGQLIRTALYESGTKNEKCRPVVLRKEDVDCIPTVLRSVQYFNLERSGGYDRLYRALTGQPSIIAPPLGKPKILPAS